MGHAQLISRHLSVGWRSHYNPITEMAVAHTFGLMSMQRTDPESFVNVNKYAQKTLKDSERGFYYNPNVPYSRVYAELYVYSEL